MPDKHKSQLDTNIHRSSILCGTALLLASGALSEAAVVLATQSSTGTAYSGTAWAGTISTTDLINAGQSTFSSATVSATFGGGFGPAGLNNGTSGDFDSSSAGGNTFFYRANNNFPATATFFLNVSTNTFGYDITSIQSFLGWDTVSQAQANQTYTVAARTVGSSDFNTFATVSFTPFPDVNGSKYESRVVVSEDSTGVLASGVDAIRFTFTDPLLSVTPSSGTIEGTVIRELDVYGTATIPEPSAILLGLLSLLPFLGRRR